MCLTGLFTKFTILQYLWTYKFYGWLTRFQEIDRIIFELFGFSTDLKLYCTSTWKFRASNRLWYQYECTSELSTCSNAFLSCLNDLHAQIELTNYCLAGFTWTELLMKLQINFGQMMNVEIIHYLKMHLRHMFVNSKLSSSTYSLLLILSNVCKVISILKS